MSNVTATVNSLANLLGNTSPEVSGSSKNCSPHCRRGYGRVAASMDTLLEAKTAVDLKAPIASPTFTGTVAGLRPQWSASGTVTIHPTRTNLSVRLNRQPEPEGEHSQPDVHGDGRGCDLDDGRFGELRQHLRRQQACIHCATDGTQPESQHRVADVHWHCGWDHLNHGGPRELRQHIRCE